MAVAPAIPSDRSQQEPHDVSNRRWLIGLLFCMLNLIFFPYFIGWRVQIGGYQSSTPSTPSKTRADSGLQPCFGLSNFPETGIPVEYLVGTYGLKTKLEYFDMLRQLGFYDENLCLEARNDAKFVDLVDLHKLGYRYVVFVGDSVVREVAWGFSRLAAERIDPATACRPSMTHERFQNTVWDPSFKCRKLVNVPSGILCAAKDQSGYDSHGLDTLPENCCNSDKFFTYYVNSNGVNTPPDVPTLQGLHARCPCKGLVWMNYGLHLLFRHTETPQNLWSQELRRAEALEDLILKLQGSSPPLSNFTFVFSTTSVADNVIMTLEPKKHDYNGFKQLQFIDVWAHADHSVIERYGVHSAPFYEVSKRFRGLQSDGLHFGANYEHGWGCDRGFMQVTDILIQLALHAIVRPNEPQPTVC